MEDELTKEKRNQLEFKRQTREKIMTQCNDEKIKLRIEIEKLKTEISRMKSDNPPSKVEKNKSSVDFDYSKLNNPSSSGSLRHSSVTNSSLAYKLAVVEKNGSVKGNDILVNRFEYLLKSLDQKYVESNQQIADKTTKAKEILQKYGVDENLRNIMEGMNSLNDPNDVSKRYQEYISTYIVIRKEYSHSKTIRDLQSSLDLAGIDGLLRASGIK